MINIRSNVAPKPCLNPVIKSIEPKAKDKMIETNKNVATNSGIFLLVMWLIFFRNLLSFLGLRKQKLMKSKFLLIDFPDIKIHF
tara:strand:+ start:428 stop:679 length:252 start_codon:yes stop_codon:yes gene_type:complete